MTNNTDFILSGAEGTRDLFIISLPKFLIEKTVRKTMNDCIQCN